MQEQNLIGAQPQLNEPPAVLDRIADGGNKS